MRMMSQIRNATLPERIRGWIYKFISYPMVIAFSLLIALLVEKNDLMNPIIDNASTLAITGAAIAAFLFTIQSVLISVPKENPFMQHIRNDGRYLIYVHKFCLIAEIAFMAIMLPMLYMDKNRKKFNIIALTVFIASLIFTIWSMYLICRILIDCEKHSND